MTKQEQKIEAIARMKTLKLHSNAINNLTKKMLLTFQKVMEHCIGWTKSKRNM